MLHKRFLLTCEHGGNQIPAEYSHLFAKKARQLQSHAGYDLGARELFEAFCRLQPDKSSIASVSRLLVDLNRSAHHRAVLSSITRSLEAAEKKAILQRYYDSYRDPLADWIQAQISQNSLVIHLAVHSFTPVWLGNQRAVDLGILYDPARPLEKELALAWQRVLHKEIPELRVRRNFPYLGVADGFPTWLRRTRGMRYVGIELEVNQRFFLYDPELFHELLKKLPGTFSQAAKLHM
ncbi:MAG: N-formylglutamate amidohydrolase [Leptospiraceae bacterium]|nr:N-formylglutamate amidohydrolase [Leptospiraceae bacterium]